MSELALHSPVVVEVKDFACVYGEHPHELGEECPTTEVNLCAVCMPDEGVPSFWEEFLWPCAPRLAAERLMVSAFGFDVAEPTESRTA